MPAVSVIMPAYNVGAVPRRGDRVGAARRRSPTASCSIVDDGSTDGTAAIAEAFARHGSARSGCSARPNGGISAARNTRCARRRATFFALLDSDDVWSPTFLEAQMADLRRAAGRRRRDGQRVVPRRPARRTARAPLRPTRARHRPRRRSLATRRRSSSCRCSAARVYDAIGGFDEIDAQQRGLRLLAARGRRRLPVPPQRPAARALSPPRRQPVGRRVADAARHPARLHEAAPGRLRIARTRPRSSTRRSPASKPSA